MYKVLHKPSGDEIVILDATWARQIDYLRSIDKKDALVCPVCEQPVRVKAGKYRQPHFAHKHLANCPYKKESLELLKTRAVLYHWLVQKFGDSSVFIEKRVDSDRLPRPVDCWVDIGEFQFGYWIIDRRLPPDERADLQVGFSEIEVPIHLVFIADLCHPDGLNPKTRIHLTTTERAFIQTSEFDKAWQRYFDHLGGTLHYFDADQSKLTTYRDLSVVHEPQVYTGTQLETALSKVVVQTQTGEFIHPGELAQLEKRKREIEKQAQAAEQRVRLGKEFFSGISIKKERATQTPKEEYSFEKIGKCRYCGDQTSDWVTYYGETQECVCRNCHQGKKDTP